MFIPASTHFVVGTAKGVVALFRKRVSHKKIVPFEEYAEVVKGYTAVDSGCVTAMTGFNGYCTFMGGIVTQFFALSH